MNPRHIQWTMSTIQNDPYEKLQRFEKFVKPDQRPTLQIHLKMGDRPWVGTMFLCVAPSEMDEFDELRRGDFEYYNMCVLELPDPRWCNLFFDLDGNIEFNVVELHAVLGRRFAGTPITYFGKIDSDIQTHWHIIVGRPGSWRDHKTAVNSLLEDWQHIGEAADIRRKFVQAVDRGVYDRPPSLRMYNCPKVVPD